MATETISGGTGTNRVKSVSDQLVALKISSDRWTLVISSDLWTEVTQTTALKKCSLLPWRVIYQL
jgi:hypothetical protein